MFERMSRSWDLVKASWAVLRSDKELIVFPIVSSICAIIVILSFAVPSLAAGFFDAMASGRSDVRGILGYTVSFLFYLVLYSVIFYFNTALVAAATVRLRGGDPTLADGLSVASARLGKIIGFALLSATVGIIMRAISERGGIVGQIFSGIFGFVWSVATFLVVPVLVVEDIGPVDSVKRSAQLLKQTWGEQIVGNFSIGTIFGLIGFAVILAGFGLGAIASSLHSSAGVVLVVVLCIVALVAISIISSTLSAIFRAALYLYATGGDTAGYFDPSLIQDAFREKAKR
jgi:hypothetical protein